MSLYTTYQIKAVFPEGIAGTVPLEPHLVDRHIELVVAGAKNALQAGLKTEGQVTEEAIAAYKRGITSVHRVDERGPYLSYFMVLAMLRRASLNLKLLGAVSGLLAHTIQDGGVVMPRRLYPTGDLRIDQKTVSPEHKGIRQANIAIVEIIDNAELEFSIQVLNNQALEATTFRKLWTVAQHVGLGSFRHLGHGQFDLRECRKLRARRAAPEESDEDPDDVEQESVLSSA